MIVFLKSIFLPKLSVNCPSSNTCNNILKTSKPNNEINYNRLTGNSSRKYTNLTSIFYALRNPYLSKDTLERYDDILLDMLSTLQISQFIVYVNTKKRAEWLGRELEKEWPRTAPYEWSLPNHLVKAEGRRKIRQR